MFQSVGWASAPACAAHQTFIRTESVFVFLFAVEVVSLAASLAALYTLDRAA